MAGFWWDSFRRTSEQRESADFVEKVNELAAAVSLGSRKLASWRLLSRYRWSFRCLRMFRLAPFVLRNRLRSAIGRGQADKFGQWASMN
jgi:hypothetical protein